VRIRSGAFCAGGARERTGVDKTSEKRITNSTWRRSEVTGGASSMVMVNQIGGASSACVCVCVCVCVQQRRPHSDPYLLNKEHITKRGGVEAASETERELENEPQ